MRKNNFAKLVRYMKNVYHIERGFNKLTDGRVNPTYSTGQVILPVVSVGMLEHVGKEHLGEYFATVQKLLVDGGISLLHSITGRDEKGTNSWIHKYIFPVGYIPMVSELIRQMESYDFYLLDVESLRNHSTRTLEHWAHNFEQALPKIREITFNFGTGGNENWTYRVFNSVSSPPPKFTN